ncbi:MAG TPA: ABC transporter permease [Nitrospiria bacterium]|nr:ABC transporter permease [Nitrospiria bacterium]HUK56627.1 ABC transporter permease [Nitrospiria bacterium]
MKLHRILAIVNRHLMLYKRSPQRMMEIIYWPLLDLLVWGFITLYLARYKEGLPAFVTFFLGALILWDILFRAQQGICVSFLEEIWSRNLLNLFVSPLGTGEFLAATMLVSVIKVIGAAFMTILLAYLLYSFNLFVIGLSLVPFALNLVVTGWAIGIFTTAIILRFGQEAEVLAWGLAFLFQPVSAVFYPVSVLPPFLQGIAHGIPASHVFEGMRAVIETKNFPLDELIWATGLNVVYLAVAILFFNGMFRVVKMKGLLVRAGE